jgi:hypothetical protein
MSRDVWEIYQGSDGEATRALYAELEKHGPRGVIAVNLFRAQKNSARAKVYRGGRRGSGSFKGLAYERKGWALGLLSAHLSKHGQELGITFGWGRDNTQPVYPLVLYVDLPQGQISFHSASRYAGPDYPGQWDGQRVSEERILKFCEEVLNQCPQQ